MNVSYNDPDVKRALEAACGRPFGFWAGIRRGGVGSARFRLIDGPAALLEAVDREEDRGYCSLEVRPSGMVIRFRSRLETLAMAIGYAALSRVVLGSPGAGRHAPLLIGLAGGDRLLFSIHREQWGAMRRLLAGALPEGRFTASAASALT
ncbi:MAG: hypothetical protein ACK4L7_02655 [Flavobacteriales bacterium]